MSESTKVEVLAVGTELLLGQIVDTNSTWLSQRLSEVGLTCYFQGKVGDNLDRIVLAMRSALARSDVLIVCGGLGPTQDDITREAISVVANQPLISDRDLERLIQEKFTSKGREMPSNNLRQAQVPRGSQIISPDLGTAPGLIVPIGNKRIYALPGVPVEMKDMVDRCVIDDILLRVQDRSTISSRTLRIWGVSESRLSELIAPVFEELDQHPGNVTLAFLASGIEGIRIRITARVSSDQEADSVLSAYESSLREILGNLVYGVDNFGMEDALLDLLSKGNETLAIAESITAGLVASRLGRTPGISRVLKGALVAYNNQAKFDLLKVTNGLVISHECALEMALGVRELFGSTIGLALTGVAGPDLQEEQPPGTVFVACAIGDHKPKSRKLMLPGNRISVQELAAISAMDFLRNSLIS